MRQLFLATFLRRAGCVDTDALRTRAAFDLECTARELEFTPLQEKNGRGTVYGVTGCGRRATYVYGPTGQWLMNSDTQESHSAGSHTGGGRTEAKTEPEEPSEPDPTACNSAYRHIDNLTALWADWYQGAAASKPPGLSAFERVCLSLNEEGQGCLVAAYAKGHKDRCMAKLQGYPETKARLDAILLDHEATP